MRNYAEELEKRVGFIRQVLKESGACGIVYGNSGGKDSALVGILCKKACENTVGVLMPCSSRRNYEMDIVDGKSVAIKFGIETRKVDITPIKRKLVEQLDRACEMNDRAFINMAPRLRMTALYSIAAAENRLVAGTGNRSEIYVGYYTKWGDGAFDFNPISDLTVTEVYEFLRYLDAPEKILTKKPSAGLFDSQSDEDELGYTYKQLDEYIMKGSIEDKEVQAKIEQSHKMSEHKRSGLLVYTAE